MVGLVINKGKILMIRRLEPELVDAHLKWEIPGGKVDFNENPQEAIVREIKEETGINSEVIRLLPLPYTQYWDYPWGRQQTLLFGFVCRYISVGIKLQDHRVDEVMWVEIEDVKKLDRLPGVDFFIDQLG